MRNRPPRSIVSLPNMRSLAILTIAIVASTGAALGVEKPRPLVETICPLMEKVAHENGLSPMLFVRLIWRESGFRPDAVSHMGAQGIAQFMPGTATERGLADPFDPVSAIDHSARLLSDHVKEFGSFGLAAAAYNAGPERVRRWLSGIRLLPAETRAYVQFITGHPADAWKTAGRSPPEISEPTSQDLQDACRKRAPTLVHVALPDRQQQRTDRQWGVQLGMNFSQARVADLFGELKRRHGSIIGDAEPMFVTGRNLSRGRRAMVAVRIGAGTRDAALRLCERLRSDGGVCTVERN